MRAIDRTTAWMNSASVSADAVQWRIVLVGFGTLTCINSEGR
jgi:hypothetical protein